MNQVSIPAAVESELSQGARDTVRLISVVPREDGACQVELHAGGVDLEIFVTVNGQVEGVYFNRFACT